MPLLRITSRYFVFLAITTVTLPTIHAAVAASLPANPLVERLEQLRPHLGDPLVSRILEKAEKIAEGPIHVRVYSVAEMAGREGVRVPDARNKAQAVLRNGLKWTSDPAEIARNAEQFALASTDTVSTRLMLEELPLLAAAARLTKNPIYTNYLIRQLGEIVTWKPFQRPGWSISSSAKPIPAGGDGVWLSTGALLQALALMDEISPLDSLPPELVSAVRERVAEEVELTRTDWVERRPWYVRAEAINSNQWVVPSSGMLAGAVMLGREKHPEAYELAVTNLRKSLAVAGPDGSMSEGYTYAMAWTSLSLLLTNHFMQVADDPLFVHQPFFSHFPDYLALYFQPGGNMVNVSDAFPAQRGFFDGARIETTRIAALTDDPGLNRVVMEVLGGPRLDFFGLLVLGHHFADSSPVWPPTQGLFERTRLFVWRSSWDKNASGVWVRGGDVADFHDNFDRGHVNFIAHGVPILIEAGTPGYASPRKPIEYDSAFGHNVLRLADDVLPIKAPAAITVVRADASGGAVKVDLRQAYPQLATYQRDVVWTADEMTVTDNLTTKSGAPVSPRATWHLATAEKPQIERISDRRVIVRVPAGRIVFPAWIGEWENPDSPPPAGNDVFTSSAIRVEIEADQPFTVNAGERPDHTLKFRRFENLHSTIELSVDSPAESLSMTTRVFAE